MSFITPENLQRNLTNSVRTASYHRNDKELSAALKPANANEKFTARELLINKAHN